jgi:hypothetical protein
MPRSERCTCARRPSSHQVKCYHAAREQERGDGGLQHNVRFCLYNTVQDIKSTFSKRENRRGKTTVVTGTAVINTPLSE